MRKNGRGSEELILVKADGILNCVHLYALSAMLLLTTTILIRRHAHQLGK